jgi:hypothetical protein
MRGFRSRERSRGGPGIAEVTAVGRDRQYFTLTSETQAARAEDDAVGGWCLDRQPPVSAPEPPECGFRITAGLACRAPVQVCRVAVDPADRVQQSCDGDIRIALGTGSDHCQQNKPCLGLT